MDRHDCDAIVLFGATGDLCYRKIYPALYQLVRRRLLTVPVIGVGVLAVATTSLTAHVIFAAVLTVLAAIALWTGLKFAPKGR